MSDAPHTDWQVRNHQALAAAIAEVKGHLTRKAEGEPPLPAQEPQDDPSSALAGLCRLFRLTPFERSALVLCAGAEMDAETAALCARIAGDPQRAYPTFSLALAALPGAFWGALAPSATLRRWRLVETLPGHGLTGGPLRIDERVLHALAGIDYLDERLTGAVRPLDHPGALVPSHQALADQIAATWRQAPGYDRLPIIQLCGMESRGKQAVAAAACAQAKVRPWLLDAAALPTAPGEVETLVRLWEREAALTSSGLLLDCDGLGTEQTDRTDAIERLMERLTGVLIVAARDRKSARRRAMVTFDVARPTVLEQETLWREAFGPEQDIAAALPDLTAHFDLGAQTIRAAALTAQGRAALPDSPGLAQELWDACRTQARPKLDDLAQRIEAGTEWDDLILPAAQKQILHSVIAHVRQRRTVYRDWKFGGKSGRGLGISALFAGESGTGKTTAAEVIARELHLDLYRIDLSAVVSKYIGESEKNLSKVFDAAEEGGVILLFDEADALFGKRSDVKDSHDRYANMEVSYLLQRMEAYRGLAILTTNLKTSMDTAFQRRIRFIVQFPFPGPAERAEIWRRVYPPTVPTDGLDPERLSQLNVAGGTIRNIALNAAFEAAEAGEPVRMAHVLHAARLEYSKLEKTLTAAEINGWSEISNGTGD